MEQLFKKYTAEEIRAMEAEAQADDNEAPVGPLRAADEQLTMIEGRVTSGLDTPEEKREKVDLVLKQLVLDTIDAYKRGAIDIHYAGSMLLIAIEKIDEYKDDGNPLTNGEKIAAALAGAPTELLEGPLRQFVEAEGNGELADILGEITRNSNDNMDILPSAT